MANTSAIALLMISVSSCGICVMGVTVGNGGVKDVAVASNGQLLFGMPYISDSDPE